MARSSPEAPLLNSPQAFGSALAWEQAFDDAQWRNRLFNPQATTIIARETATTRADGSRILSSVTLIGPSPVPDLIKSRLVPSSDYRPVLHWQLNGIFTPPGARRLGISRAVMEVARERAIREADRVGNDVAMTVIVYTGNGAAKSWYEQMGFREFNTGEDQTRPTSELVLLFPPRSLLCPS